jgi:hypothetical protein
MSSTNFNQGGLIVDTKSFHVGVAAQMGEAFDKRLKEMDQQIAKFIAEQGASDPRQKIMITSAMGENVYTVTVVITSPNSFNR